MYIRLIPFFLSTSNEIQKKFFADGPLFFVCFLFPFFFSSLVCVCVQFQVPSGIILPPRAAEEFRADARLVV
jgi:hypothetical protein